MHHPLHAAATPDTLKASSLRIALVTETFAPEVNGVAMTLGRLVQGLLARGHQVEVVRPRQPGPADSGAPDPWQSSRWRSSRGCTATTPVRCSRRMAG